MKKTLQIILLSLLPMLAMAQVNILEQLGESQIGYQYWIQKGDYYYFVSKQMTGVPNDATGYKASQYILNKYDKNTFQRLAWKVIAGDTLQNDSVVANPPALYMAGDRFYIHYTKYRVQGQFIKNAEYYKQIKEDFSTVVAEKRFGEENLIVYTITSCSGPMEDGRFFVGYKTNDTFNSNTSGYVILDSLGNVVQSGLPGLPHPNGPMAKTFRSFFPLGNHKYLQSGLYFLGAGPETGFPYHGWCVVDEEMNLLDTFSYKKGLVQSDTPIMIGVMPMSIALPSGSIITVNSTSKVQIEQEPVGYPLITKHTNASHFGVDKYLTFGRLDSTDLSHGGFRAYQQLAYNPKDNKLYFGFTTHMQDWGLICSPYGYKSYLEVICTDTNLNVNWRKFIKMKGVCSLLGTLSVPDNGNGIYASGYSFTDYDVDTFKMWVYHLDDSTPSADPTAIAAIKAAQETVHVYPNPTNGMLYITSENNQLKEAALYDLSGRLLFTKNINTDRSQIDLSGFKKGVYFLKCLDKYGNRYVKKILKE